MPNMGEKTHNSEEVNKEKDEEKYTKNIIIIIIIQFFIYLRTELNSP
jgi:hypothetical protein